MKRINFKSFILTITILLTLGVGQMWGAWSFSGTSYMYFHNKGSWTDAGKMLFIGKSDYSSVYTMSAVTGHTTLWVVQLPSSGWSDASYMAVAGAGSVWGSGSWGPSNRTNATHYTNTYTSGLEASDTQRYILIPSGTANNSSISLTYLGTSDPNYTITVKAKISTNNGSSYSEATSPGTLSASSKKFTAYNSCNSATSLSSGKIICGYLYSTTLTAPSTDPTGYTFVGWYNSSGTRQTTSKTLTITPTEDATYYAYYKANQYSGTINANGGAANQSYTATYKTTSLTIATAPTRTGYNLNGYYKEAACTTLVANTSKALQASTGYTNASKQWTNTSSPAPTLYAGWTAKTYSITLDREGATTGSTSVTMTYNSSTHSSITMPTKTGYDFGGYWSADNGTGSMVMNASGVLQANVDGYTGAGGIWTKDATCTLYAKWTAKTTTITYSQSGTGYGSGGPSTTQIATYGSAMPSISKPTAANGYAFMGYYDAAGGSGTQYYTSAGASARTWNKTDATCTLYAYFKKAEITNLAFSAGTVMEPSTSFTVTATIAPTPVGSKHIDWKLRYGNDNLVESQPSFGTGTTTNSVTAPAAGGSYKIEAVLRTGTTANSGTTLDSVVYSFSIASDHTVTIEYRSGSATGDIIKASTTNPGKPLEWTSITAPSITGYSFTKWKAGDGITIEDADANGEKASATIKYKANYDGKLIAIYNKKKMIYFNNTLGWSNVYVYFYNTNEYWDNTYGSGAQQTQAFNGDHKPYWEQEHGTMTRIAGTNIWYFEYSYEITRANICFTKTSQHGNQWFDNTEVVRVCDAPFNPTTLPMFVPLSSPTENKNVHGSYKTIYYTQGYWMNYPENPGYWLKIFDKVSGSPDPVVIQDIPFEYNANKTVPMSLTVDLEAGRTYGFKIYRNDGAWLGNGGTMKINHSGDFTKGETVWEFTTGTANCGLKTSVAGDYIFTLSYGLDGYSNYNTLVGVHYPIAQGDYRIVYNDRIAWSQKTAHASTWWHPSRAIHKENGSVDTISFYVSKAAGASASMKFQYASSITTEGVVSWADKSSGSINLSSITKSGVYNFILSQSSGNITVSKIEPYDGNYYIRTDKAGPTKWDNFRARDHQMTYTEFSNSAANAFGDKFTHYFAKWCPAGTNVKFVIANDYSVCVSDTLIQDIDNPYSNINASGFLNSDGNPEETQNIYSANIRFMYNEETNKISRAYVASSTNAARKFLVLNCESGKTILDDEGNPLDGTGEDERSAIFQDKENFIYERILEITPNTKFKLYACYAAVTPTIANAQYFAGNYAGNAWTDGNYVVLISGSGDRQKVRVIYDFKTNRLVAAWIPTEGVSVSGNMDIDADVMVLRDHQKAAECITFASGGKLTDVKTVYGAMKFNRWTLSNRKRGLGNAEDNNKNHCINADSIAVYHAILPAGEQKSIYERSLYFVSFPFDVKLSEVFGFGKYWDEWYIEYYDGLNRAKNGYWMDSPPNWKFVTPSMYEDFVLNAYEGYILGLDLDFMGYDNTTFWANNISNVELYFPSREQMGTIQTTNVTIPALNTIEGDPYRCTINRGTEEGDRRFKDSYWRCIGVPSYNEYAGTLTSNGSTTINWHSGTDYTDYFPFLYAWNMNDNTLTAQTGSTFPFKPMHAYLTQVPSAIYWTNVSATPSSIVARQKTEEQPKEFSWRLALIRNEQEEDQAYIRMANLEQVTDTFDFGQDLMKELNSPRSNIYSYIGYERVAANSMPIHTEGITIPLGLNIISAGEYTFSMPDGTQGVGITLVDSEANTRTSLSALDYTVTLEKADYNDRFFLEISPINYIPTGMENGEATDGEKGARKVLINGLLYIVRDGKMFDARGVRVE